MTRIPENPASAASFSELLEHEGRFALEAGFYVLGTYYSEGMKNARRLAQQSRVGYGKIAVAVLT
jgi:hypothetical protein